MHFIPREVADVESLFAVRPNMSFDNSTAKERSDVGGLIAVRIIDDQVGSTINTQDSGNLHQQTRLLPHFANGCVSRLFAWLDQTPGCDPDVFIPMQT